jgi:hypothetical protein
MSGAAAYHVKTMEEALVDDEDQYSHHVLLEAGKTAHQGRDDQGWQLIDPQWGRLSDRRRIHFPHCLVCFT